MYVYNKALINRDFGPYGKYLFWHSRRMGLTAFGPYALNVKTNVSSYGPRARLIRAYDERTCKSNPAGENSSFTFTVSVKSVPLYHFKLAYVVLLRLSKNFSDPTSKNGEISRFNLQSHFYQPWNSVAVYCWIRIQSFKRFSFCFNRVYNS